MIQWKVKQFDDGVDGAVDRGVDWEVVLNDGADDSGYGRVDILDGGAND